MGCDGATLVTLGLDRLSEGFGIFDNELRLVSCNRLFRKLRNFPDEICQPGVTLEELMRFNAERGDFGPGSPDAQVAERMAEIAQSGERVIEREMADGLILRIRYDRIETGGLVVTFQDITETYKAQHALAASEERYALVAEAAEEAIYEWDIERSLLFASPRLEQMLGVKSSAAGERDWAWSDLVHPDDAERYEAAVAAHLSGDMARWECEYRIKTKDGAYRWISDHGTSVRNAGGKATRLIAAIRDVTERIERDAALALSEERLDLVAQATSDGLYDWNIETNKLFVSDRLNALFDFKQPMKTSQEWAQRIHEDDLPAYLAALVGHFKGDTGHLEAEYRILAGDGEYRWVLDHGIGVRNDSGRVVRLVGAVRDITDIKMAQSELNKVEQRLLESLDTISDGFLLVDSDDKVQMWNRRYMEIFGAAAGSDISDILIAGRPFIEMIRHGYERGMFQQHPDGVEGWIAERRQRRVGDASDLEMELSNGRWLLINERRMSDGGRVSIYTDITDFKTRERELEMASNRFEDAIEALSSGFVLFDADDRIVVCNTKYREYFAELEDMVAPGTPFVEIIRAGVDRGMFPSANKDREAWIAELLKRRAAVEGIREQRLQNGTWLQVSDHRTKDGGIVSIYTNVTELKTREEELRTQSAILEATLENMGQAISMVDENLNVVMFNRKFLEYFDFPEEDFKRGFHMSQAFRLNAERGEYGEGDIEGQVRECLELAAKFEAHRFERTRPDGVTLEMVGTPAKEGGFVTTYTDITERKRAEQELAEKEKQLRLALDNMPGGMVLCDRDLNYVLANPQYSELCDFPEGLVEVGNSTYDTIRFQADRGDYGPGEREEQVRELDELHRKADPVNYERTIASTNKTLQIYLAPTPEGGYVSIITDITERKKVEQSLYDREAQLKAALQEFNAVLDSIKYGIVFMDPSLRARIINRAFGEMWGIPQEFVDKSPTMQELIEHNRDTGVYDVSPDKWDQWLAARLEVVRKGDLAPTELRRADGKVLQYQVISLPDGGRMLTYFDITELKQREDELTAARDHAEQALLELQKAQERLVQAEKMASLGQLTAGIAHEIKNPLNFVNNFAKLSNELLLELTDILAEPIASLDGEDREDAEDLLDTVTQNLRKIDEHGRRADSIVKNMLLHSRDGPSEMQRSSVNAIAEEALNLAYHGARAEDSSFNIDMKKLLSADVGEIECFPQDLMRVFLNLISNGMYAATRHHDATRDRQPSISIESSLEDSAAVIKVTDNGAGIPEEMRDKIFAPFFTTKPAGEGTGLGLSLSYDIVVKQHGGTMTVDSEPGMFTTFTITLPKTLATAKSQGDLTA